MSALSSFLGKLLAPAGYDLAILIVRIILAVCVFPHGAQKLLGWWGGPGFERILTGFHDRLGIPYFITVLVVISEFFGSIALAAGMATRVVAASFIFVMLGAIFVAGQIDNGFFMNFWGRNPGEGIEYNLLVLGVSLALVVCGAGKYSIDALAAKKLLFR